MKLEEIKNFIIFKTYDAKVEEWENVSMYVEGVFEKNDINSSLSIQLLIVLEELFVNIAHYAYEGKDDVEKKMQLGIGVKDKALYLVFIDKGIPFDPLKRDDPDINLPMEERSIGGLGIYMTKKAATDISYERKDDQNILIFKKEL